MVELNKESGVHVNKDDEMGWKGRVQLNDYPINIDTSPQIIHKQLNQTVNYIQPVTIKYLKPPTPATTGEIIIKQEADVRVEKAPPVIIRQQPCETATPEPLVLKEQPPVVPPEIENKVISIPGKLLAPPPRKMIIEKLPMLPNKPRPIIIEKWLPYEPQTRVVKFVRAQQVDNWSSEKNLIIQWDSPRAVVTKEVHELGTVRCDPSEYMRLHRNDLLSNYEINNVIRQQGIELKESVSPNLLSIPRLEGDIDALKLIDLDMYGLSEYKSLIKSKSSITVTTTNEPVKTVYLTTQTPIQTVYADVFKLAVVDSKGRITKKEAIRLLELIHERLGKTINRSRIIEFVDDISRNNNVGFEQFKRLVINWVQL